MNYFNEALIILASLLVPGAVFTALIFCWLGVLEQSASSRWVQVLPEDDQSDPEQEEEVKYDLDNNTFERVIPN